VWRCLRPSAINRSAPHDAANGRGEAMSDYNETRQALRNVLREVCGYSGPQTDVLLDALEAFFTVRQLANEPASAPDLPDLGRIQASRGPRQGRSPAA
jgi:hypothetical protein